MIDLMNVAAYRENNRIEAKKALGGLPRSIWETYSAFANTLGGVILLGVEEHKDTSLSPVDLPDPRGMVEKFWSLLRDGKTVSVNILAEENIRIAEVDGKHFIAIEVPRARRSLRPVYIGGDPMTGTYRRSGEGDYRCKREEVQEMQRDAALRTGDMRLLTEQGMDALDGASVAAYSACAGSTEEDAEVFLQKIGAAAKENGVLHPTGAGLLMFGRETELRRQYPACSLQYRCDMEGEEGTAITGGNVFDFYTQVEARLEAAFEPEVCSALRKALTNCLLNADYQSGGVEIFCSRELVSFSNAGQFRVDVAAAVSGGVSDPRNLALARMFAGMGAGQGNGRGLSEILALWRQKGWQCPTIRETFDPARVTVRLPVASEESGKEAALTGEVPFQLRKGAALAYITAQIRVSQAQLAAHLGGDAAAAARCLAELLREGILMEETPGIYRLKR